LAAALQMRRSEGVKEVKVTNSMDDFGRSIANIEQRKPKTCKNLIYSDYSNNYDR